MKRQQQQPKISSFFNKKAKTTPAPAPAAAPPVVDLTAEDPAETTEPWRPALDPATVPGNARAALNNAHDALPEAGQRPPPPPRENGPTPMAKQIQQLIRDNKGCFLAVEVGYKYKCFGTDVPRAAKTLGIGSWKDAQLGDMCTFPTGTIDDKIRRLVRDGHRVAVARQTERAALRQKSGGTFSRAVDRVYSRATLIGDEFGDDTDAAWLVAAVDAESTMDLVAVELRSQRRAACEGADKDKADAFVAAHPPAEALVVGARAERLMRATDASVATFDTEGDAEELLLAYCEAAGVSSALERCLERAPSSTVPMRLDASTLRDLEVLVASDGSTTGAAVNVVARHASTKAGRNLLRDWFREPLTNRDAIEARQQAAMALHDDQVAALTPLIDLLLKKGSGDKLAKRADGARAALAARRARPSKLRDLLAGARAVADALPENVSSLPTALAMSEASAVRKDVLAKTNAALERLDADACADDAGPATALLTSDEDDDALAVARRSCREADAALDAKLKELRATLRKPALQWTHINGGAGGRQEFLIEATRSEADGFMRRGAIDDAWHVASETQKVRRFVAPGVSALVSNRAVAVAEADLAADVSWRTFVADLDDELSAPLRKIFDAVALIDATRALGRLGGEPGWCWPALGRDLDLEGFAHPTLTGDMVTNDLKLDAGACLVLTGPNAGGKSSVARAVALASIYAQAGAPVFAKRAALPLRDAVFTRMGAADALAAGRSTFLHELERAAVALEHATDESLVVLDELGRGTATHDGVAVAGAALDALVARGCATIFVTHYHDLAASARAARPAQVATYRMAYAAVGGGTLDIDSELVMLYKLVEGLADESFGLHAAKAAGLPDAVLRLAQAKREALLLESS